MLTNGVSPYQNRGYSNKVVRWIPGDHEEKYIHNMKNHRDLMKYNSWDGYRGEFTYRFNSQGFRADEFGDEPSVMFLGCSLTMGLGIELEHTWAFKVAQDLGLKNHNLATGGSSNDACYRLFTHWHRIHKPKIVIHYSPSPERLEAFYGDGRINNMLPSVTKHIENNQFYGIWLSNEINSVMNEQKNRYAIELMCMREGIRYYWLGHHQMFSIEDGFEYDKKSLGRDLLHPGAYWHRNMHKRIMTELNVI
jgi:hypothetical protein